MASNTLHVFPSTCSLSSPFLSILFQLWAFTWLESVGGIKYNHKATCIGVMGNMAGLGAMEARNTPGSYEGTKSVPPVSIMSFMKSIEGLGSRGYVLNLSYPGGLHYLWVTGTARRSGERGAMRGCSSFATPRSICEKEKVPPVTAPSIHSPR